MLVLERKLGQTIILLTAQGTVTIKLNRIRPGAAQIAIDAPYSIRVCRDQPRPRRRTQHA